MVNKAWIQDFKSEFQYENICNEIKKNKEEEEIIYYIKNKMKKENQNKICPNFNILYKKSNSSNNYLNYYKEFEIDKYNYCYELGKIYNNNLFIANYLIEFTNNISSLELIEIINNNSMNQFLENIYFTNTFYLYKDNKKFQCFSHKLDYNDELECIKFIISSFYNLYINFEKEFYNSHYSSSIKYLII